MIGLAAILLLSAAAPDASAINPIPCMDATGLGVTTEWEVHPPTHYSVAGVDVDHRCGADCSKLPVLQRLLCKDTRVP